MQMAICGLCEDRAPSVPTVAAVAVDGTLPRDQNPFDVATGNTLARVTASGTTLVLATTRTRSEALRWAKLTGAAWVLPLNGAALVRADGHVKWTSPGVDDDLMTRLIDQARINGLHIHVHTLADWHPPGSDARILAYGTERQLTPIWRNWRSGEVLQAEIVGRCQSLAALDRDVDFGDHTVTRTLNKWVGSFTIGPAGVNTGVAINHLLPVLGATPERLLAIGNGPDDAELLAGAAIAVSVQTADPSLQRFSTHRVRLDPDQGAVRHTLDAFVRGLPVAHKHLECLHRPTWRDPAPHE